ncbi:hypothetical protein HK102_001426 [Quaeritorhiza haematococci]|nr:hypothetical protein HK102_001426 [Quaeritorhiza haematococci]
MLIEWSVHSQAQSPAASTFLPPKLRVGELLNYITAQHIASSEHTHVDLTSLRSWAGISGEHADQQLFHTVLTYEMHGLLNLPLNHPLSVEDHIPMSEAFRVYQLELVAFPQSQGHRVEFHYDKSSLSEWAAQSVAKRFIHVLELMVESSSFGDGDDCRSVSDIASSLPDDDLSLL